MAKRKQRVLARKKTASKRGKAHTRAKSAPKKAAKRIALKTKAKKQVTKAHVKPAAPKRAAPRAAEPPRQPVLAPDETVIFDIIEEPVPGVVVVTEFETVRTSRPATPTVPAIAPDGVKMTLPDPSLTSK
jgi:hypothetical protein